MPGVVGMHWATLAVGGLAGGAGGYAVGRSHQAVIYWVQMGRKLRRDIGTFRRGPRWR